MRNLIELPKRKMKATEGLQRAEAKQILLSLAVVCSVVAMVMMNDTATRNQRPIYIISDNSLNHDQVLRMVASAENNENVVAVEDIQWEHKLAAKLAPEADAIRAPASVGTNADEIDGLKYGVLAGNYSVQTTEQSSVQDQSKGSIAAIQYQDGVEIASRPQRVDTKSFLKKYKHLLAVSFEKFELIEDSKDQVAGRGREVYRLMDSSERPVGEILFVLDDKDGLISMNILKRAASQIK